MTFPDKGLVITALCSASGDGKARVTVTGWDAHTWKKTVSRTFSVPAEAVDSSRYFRQIIKSPVKDLCSDAVEDGASDGTPHPIPESSLRQLFDKDYTRMAVVLIDRHTQATRVGYVDTSGKVTELSDEEGEEFADAPHEENAVFSKDGSAVWFTEGAGSTVRIASRAVARDHAHTEHGGGDLNDTGARLTLTGDPARGVYAVDARISPDGRKALAFISGAGYHIVDLPQHSGALDDERGMPYISYDIDCYGWVDEVRVLCAPDDGQPDPKRRNSFWTLNTSGLAGGDEVPESAMGKPIIPPTDRKNTVQAISPDGKQMIFASLQGTRLTYYLSSTAPGASPKTISELGAEAEEALSTGYVLEWR